MLACHDENDPALVDGACDASLAERQRRELESEGEYDKPEYHYHHGQGRPQRSQDSSNNQHIQPEDDADKSYRSPPVPHKSSGRRPADENDINDRGGADDIRPQDDADNNYRSPPVPHKSSGRRPADENDINDRNDAEDIKPEVYRESRNQEGYVQDYEDQGRRDQNRHNGRYQEDRDVRREHSNGNRVDGRIKESGHEQQRRYEVHEGIRPSRGQVREVMAREEQESRREYGRSPREDTDLRRLVEEIMSLGRRRVGVA